VGGGDLFFLEIPACTFTRKEPSISPIGRDVPVWLPVWLRSDDSATRRRKEAERKLCDFGEAAAEAGSGGSGDVDTLPLPSALSVFEEVGGPPSFLDPEATRPLAAPVHRGAPVRGQTGRRTDGRTGAGLACQCWCSQTERWTDGRMDGVAMRAGASHNARHDVVCGLRG
jgi:hypothetical protein